MEHTIYFTYDKPLSFVIYGRYYLPRSKIVLPKGTIIKTNKDTEFTFDDDINLKITRITIVDKVIYNLVSTTEETDHQLNKKSYTKIVDYFERFFDKVKHILIDKIIIKNYDIYEINGYGIYYCGEFENLLRVFRSRAVNVFIELDNYIDKVNDNHNKIVLYHVNNNRVTDIDTLINKHQNYIKSLVTNDLSYFKDANFNMLNKLEITEKLGLELDQLKRYTQISELTLKYEDGSNINQNDDQIVNIIKTTNMLKSLTQLNLSLYSIYNEDIVCNIYDAIIQNTQLSHIRLKLSLHDESLPITEKVENKICELINENFLSSLCIVSYDCVYSDKIIKALMLNTNLKYFRLMDLQSEYGQPFQHTVVLNSSKDIITQFIDYRTNNNLCDINLSIVVKLSENEIDNENIWSDLIQKYHHNPLLVHLIDRQEFDCYIETIDSYIKNANKYNSLLCDLSFI